MHLYPINGVCHDVAGDATAFGHRDANFAMVVLAASDNPADDPLCTPNGCATTRTLWRPIRSRWAMSTSWTMTTAGRVRDNYGGNYDRLVEIKRRYDP